VSYYLVIPYIEVKAANALASNYAISAAPIMAISLFAHNLGRQTRNEALGVAVIHHDAQFLGEHGSGFARFAFQQRRAATFINKDDYAGSGQTLSLQPTANVHLTLSLIIEMKRPPQLGRTTEALTSGRIAGGRIERFGDPVSFDAGDDALLGALPKGGFWLLEREDLMHAHDNPVVALITALGQRPQRASSDPEDESPNNSWLTPAVLGYAATTSFEKRTGVRMLDDDHSIPLHAFAEPLLGLAQYVSLRDYANTEIPFWRTSWIEPGVFVTRCES